MSTIVNLILNLIINFINKISMLLDNPDRLPGDV
jgi:hypothetical protein